MSGKLETYTFKSTGHTVIVPPISTIVLHRKISKANPAPDPPLVEMDYGGNDIRYEPNKSDPNWQEALRLNSEEVAMITMDAALRRIALAQTLNDEKREKVEELREALAGIEEFDSNDKIVWFFEIAVGKDSEIQEILAQASGNSDPSAKGVSSDVGNFRSDIPGNEHMGSASETGTDTVS